MASVQEPIGSGFTALSTAQDVIDAINLTGRTAVVTGGYSGIGLETVRVLRSAGAEVIVPVRDRGRAESALRGIDAHIEMMDLLDPASIQKFAHSFLSCGRPLHILVNSAGIMASPLSRDARGYESQFATNHLGHFQLTVGLWPALRRARGARVVSVSSWGHRRSPVVFDDLHFNRRDYDAFAAYGQSKTANILFALALDELGAAEGVRAFSLHPGSISGTGLGKYLSVEELRAAGAIDEQGNPVVDPANGHKTVGQGAATSVWCATSQQLEGMGGIYCENVEVARPVPEDDVQSWELGQATQSVGVMPHAIDHVAAHRLWKVSETLTGVTAGLTA